MELPAGRLIPEKPRVSSASSLLVEQSSIAYAAQPVVQSTPVWRNLFVMPKRYRRMTTCTSSASVLAQQTIHLGRGAFRDEETLRETPNHEHVHDWPHFIAGVYDLQTPEASNDYVLPSDTTGMTFAASCPPPTSRQPQNRPTASAVSASGHR